MSEQKKTEQIGAGGPSFNAESDRGEAGSGDAKVFSGFLDERANLGETVPEDLEVNPIAEVRDINIRDDAQTPLPVTKTHECQNGSGRESEDGNQCSTSGQSSGNTSLENRGFNLLGATASENEGAAAEKELNRDGGEFEELEKVNENPHAEAARRADSFQAIQLTQTNIALPKQLALDHGPDDRDVPSTSKVPELPINVQPEPNFDNLLNLRDVGDFRAEHPLQRQHSTKAKNAIVREQGSLVTNDLDKSQETRDHPRSDTEIPENNENNNLNEAAISRLDETGNQNISHGGNQNSNQDHLQLLASEQRYEEIPLEQLVTSEASTPDAEPTENGRTENKADFLIPGNQMATVLSETDEEEDGDASDESDDQSSEAETEVKRKLYVREAVAVQIAEHSSVALDPPREVTKLTTTVGPCIQQQHQSADDREATARVEFRSLTSGLDDFLVPPSDSDETETDEEHDRSDGSPQLLRPDLLSHEEDSADELDLYGPSLEDPRMLARRPHEVHPDIVEIQRGLQRLQCMISMWSVAFHFDNVAIRTTILPAAGDVYRRFLNAPPEEVVYQNSPQDVAEHLYSRGRRTTVLPMAHALYRSLLQPTSQGASSEGQLVLPTQRASIRIGQDAEKRDAIPPDGCNVLHFPNPSDESPGLTVESNNNPQNIGCQVFHSFEEWLRMLPPEADVLSPEPGNPVRPSVRVREHCVQCGEAVGNGHQCRENQINTRAFVDNAGQEIPEDVRAFNDDPNM